MTNQCLGLGHETMVRAVCFTMFLWCHQMKTFSTLLALCHRWISQKSVTRSFDVFFDLRLNKTLSKQSRNRWLRRHRAHYDVTVMPLYFPNKMMVIEHQNYHLQSEGGFLSIYFQHRKIFVSLLHDIRNTFQIQLFNSVKSLLFESKWEYPLTKRMSYSSSIWKFPDTPFNHPRMNWDIFCAQLVFNVWFGNDQGRSR